MVPQGEGQEEEGGGQGEGGGYCRVHRRRPVRVLSCPQLSLLCDFVVHFVIGQKLGLMN